LSFSIISAAVLRLALRCKQGPLRDDQSMGAAALLHLAQLGQAAARNQSEWPECSFRKSSTFFIIWNLICTLPSYGDVSFRR
jgi:hypothetical protein